MNRVGLSLLAVVLAGCGQQSPADPAAPIIPATTKVADADTRAALRAYDPVAGTLTFSASTPTLGAVKVGDVVVSEPSAAAPYGYLRRVQGIRTDNGAVVLDTTQANLTDAITRGSLKVEAELTEADLPADSDLLVGEAVRSAGTLAPQAGFGQGFRFGKTFNQTFVPLSGPTARGQVKVDGSVGFNAGYGLNFDISPCWSPPFVCLDSFEASVGFDQSARFRVTGEAQGQLGSAVKIGEQVFTPKVFFIAVVPVVVVPRLELYLTAGGEIQASVDFDSGQSATAKVGVRWTDDDGWKPLQGLNVRGDVRPPTFAGALKPRAGIQATTSVTLYGLAGPEASLEGGLELDAKIPRNPAWIVSGYLRGTVGFRAKLPVIGTLANYQSTLFDKAVEFGRSVNSPPRLTLTTVPLSVNQGQSTNFRAGCDNLGTFFYTARDPEDGCNVTVAVQSSLDGTLGPDHTFSSAGVRRITITARDTQGATSRLEFDLNVLNPPPTLTLQYSGDPHQGEAYSVAATISDPDEPTKTDLCNNTTWGVDAPDTLSRVNGCQILVTFGATGSRQVRVSVSDSQGAVTQQAKTFTVLPPLANPYPKITYANVFNRETPRSDSPGCSTRPVFPGEIDLTLRRTGCGEPGPTLYFAGIELENPQNEALTYEWKFYVSGPYGEIERGSSTETILNLYDYGNDSRTTTPCRVTLTLNAPDPSRSKSLTVWSGPCTYHATILK
ncbi:hypothetical protein E7T06_05515 [Deinococcus sp. Arct2-2]|uniref:hypothetical protein n=1 Tax=Deinococcus sp. Arct2-2 TaxID=2568653 RepID=UPI0010A493DA|nr:hypothetical protein [Deinococcus sp. Arct2-2]THF70810.1 hypothetical protein E7T06_05515 [Deinococcus sp. Arct2-2]